MEERRHLLGWFQVVLPVGEELRARLVQAAVVADGGYHISPGVFPPA